MNVNGFNWGRTVLVDAGSYAGKRSHASPTGLYDGGAVGSVVSLKSISSHF